MHNLSKFIEYISLIQEIKYISTLNAIKKNKKRTKQPSLKYFNGFRKLIYEKLILDNYDLDGTKARRA